MPRTFTFVSPPAAHTAAELAVFGGPITQDDYGDLIGDTTGNATGTVEFNVFSAVYNKDFAILVRGQTPLFNTVIRLNPNEFQYSDIRGTRNATGNRSRRSQTDYKRSVPDWNRIAANEKSRPRYLSRAPTAAFKTASKSTHATGFNR
jgi:hypothetical protein